MLDGAYWYQEEKEYLANLFLHTSGLDSFIRYMTESNYEALARHIMKVCGLKSTDDLDHYNWVRQHLNLMEEIGMENYLIEKHGD